MKKNLVILLAGIMLQSCQKENQTSDPQVQVAVKFSSGIEVQKTKAAGTSWDARDSIGVFMVKNSQQLKLENIVEGANNVPYLTEDGGTRALFTPVSQTIYYPVDGSVVDFIAYYPYKQTSTEQTDTEINNFSYPIDTRVQTPQKDIDLMYAKITDKSKVSGPAELVFSHQLSKVVFNIKKGEGVEIEELKHVIVTIRGVNTMGKFNLADSQITYTADLGEVTCHKLENSLVAEAILIPQSGLLNKIVQFKVDDDVFTWKIDTDKFEAGRKYVYNVTITRNGMEASGTISDWTSGDAKDIDAN